MSILRQKKIILTAIIPLFLIIGLSIQSYAANNTVQLTTLTGLSGVSYTVDSAAGFTITNPAYTVTRDDVSTGLTTWTNNGNMSTSLVAGNWQFQITVTANAAIASATHIAKVQIDNSTASDYITLDTITFTSAIAKDDTMTLIFNVKSASIDDITAVVVTIT